MGFKKPTLNGEYSDLGQIIGFRAVIMNPVFGSLEGIVVKTPSVLPSQVSPAYLFVVYKGESSTEDGRIDLGYISLLTDDYISMDVPTTKRFARIMVKNNFQRGVTSVDAKHYPEWAKYLKKAGLWGEKDEVK